MNIGNFWNLSIADVHQLLIAVLTLIVVTLCSCASGQGTAPPGGPPDSTAPAIIQTDPANGTINFAGDAITVTFSEFVQESNVRQAVIITPIPTILPEFNWSGRDLEIEFAEPLVNDRTYAVTFGSGITDLAGNRLGKPFTLRFSTGDVIDSGRIQGSVTGLERRHGYIFAYQIPKDTNGFGTSLRPDSTHPDFIAPIADDGTFSLEALPNGRYRLLAVTDENSDQLYTPGSEAYGVAIRDAEVISQAVPATGIAIRLRPAPLDLVAPTLFSASSQYRTRTQLRFSEPIDTTVLQPENFTMTSPAGDALVSRVWRSPSSWNIVEVDHGELPDSGEIRVQTRRLRDTVGNLLPDSASGVTFRAGDVRDTIPPSLQPLAIDSLRAYVFPDSIPLIFNEAVELSNTASMVSISDSTGKRIGFRLRRLAPNRFAADPLDTVFGLAGAHLHIDLRGVSDFARNRRDTILNLALAIAPARQNGTMQGTLVDTISPEAPHVIVARHTATGKVYTKKGVRSGSWEFASIPEGEYEISAFRDVNGDGEYDYGSLTPYRPAEEYLLRRSPVRVRPRWITNEVDLIFGK